MRRGRSPGSIRRPPSFVESARRRRPVPPPSVPIDSVRLRGSMEAAILLTTRARSLDGQSFDRCQGAPICAARMSSAHAPSFQSRKAARLHERAICRPRRRQHLVVGDPGSGWSVRRLSARPLQDRSRARRGGDASPSIGEPHGARLHRAMARICRVRAEPTPAVAATLRPVNESSATTTLRGVSNGFPSMVVQTTACA
jgi:hypothetical protein